MALLQLENPKRVPSKALRRRPPAKRPPRSACGCSRLPTKPPALADKVPAGRIQGHGEAIVPFVPKQLYASIENLAKPNLINEIKPSGPSEALSPRLPANWDDIKVGDRVLAQDTDPKDGWWQAKVVEEIR